MNFNLKQNTNYSIIKKDPELQLQIIDKYVKVHLVKNRSYTGFIHSFDPVSHSIILLIPHEYKFRTAIIPGYVILEVTEEVLPANIKPPQRSQILVDSEENLAKRRKNLVAWFELNLLPASQVDDKIIVGDVTLLPPYNSLDICTQNPIVAMHINKILERMPQDFDSR